MLYQQRQAGNIKPGEGVVGGHDPCRIENRGLAYTKPVPAALQFNTSSVSYHYLGHAGSRPQVPTSEYLEYSCSGNGIAQIIKNLLRSFFGITESDYWWGTWTVLWIGTTLFVYTIVAYPMDALLTATYEDTCSYSARNLPLAFTVSFGTTMKRLMWESWVELGKDQDTEMENCPLSSHTLEQFSSNGGKASVTGENTIPVSPALTLKGLPVTSNVLSNTILRDPCYNGVLTIGWRSHIRSSDGINGHLRW